MHLLSYINLLSHNLIPHAVVRTCLVHIWSWSLNPIPKQLTLNIPHETAIDSLHRGHDRRHLGYRRRRSYAGPLQCSETAACEDYVVNIDPSWEGKTFEYEHRPALRLRHAAYDEVISGGEKSVGYEHRPALRHAVYEEAITIESSSGGKQSVETEHRPTPRLQPAINIACYELEGPSAAVYAPEANRSFESNRASGSRGYSNGQSRHVCGQNQRRFPVS